MNNNDLFLKRRVSSNCVITNTPVELNNLLLKLQNSDRLLRENFILNTLNHGQSSECELKQFDTSHSMKNKAKERRKYLIVRFNGEQ